MVAETNWHIKNFFRPTDVNILYGDSTKAKPLKAKPSLIVSELPFGMRMRYQRSKPDKPSKNISERDGSVKIMENSMELLTANGKAIFLITPSSLVNNTNQITNFRKQLIEKDYLRAIINFGHTFAHAFENIINYDDKKLIHGEAVGIGMCCALKLSVLLNICSEKEATNAIQLISKFKLPTSLFDIDWR